MSQPRSQGSFRLLLIDNKAPFDATARLFTRNVDGPTLREFLLGTIDSGQQRQFQFNGISNGEELSLHIQSLDNKADEWITCPSPVYVTFTSSSLAQARYLIKGTKQDPELKFDGLVDGAINGEFKYDHQQKAEEAGKKPVPEPSAALKDKVRWMQCVVQNKTQFLVVHDPPAYFDSGRYDDPPSNISPYDNMVFTVCNRDNAPTGATGGTAFRIILDGVAEYAFTLGWTAPLFGAFTAGVAESTNPEAGYNVSSDVGNSIKSSRIFSALDDKGREVKFRFEIAAAPGRTAWYVLNQIRVV